MADLTTSTGWSGSPAQGRDGSRRGVRPGWRALATGRLSIILGLWIAVAAIYWPSAAALNSIWTGSDGDTYTHGYLVLIASLWLLVRDRGRIEATPVRAAGWALLPLLMLSVAWLFSWRAAVQAAHVLLLPVILVVALVAALGWRLARVSLFPVGLLLFAMPVWGALNDGLQILSSKVNGVLIWLSGMPAYMQGDLIRLPGGTIQIAQTCAGLNGFVIGLTVAALYGEIERDPLRRRLIWLAMLASFALVANSVRIFIVTAAAYETDMRSPLVKHHIWLGWCLFAVAVVVFLRVARRLGDAWDRQRPREEPKEQRPSASPPELNAQGPGVTRLVVVLACMGLLPAISYGTDLWRSNTQERVGIRWPEAPQGWRGPVPDTVSEWSPRFLNASAQSLRLYIDPRARPIEAFAVAYRSQTQKAKLLAYGNTLFGGAARLQGRSQRIVGSPAGPWRETAAVDPTGVRSLIWWRYRVGDRLFTQPRLSQLWYGLASLTGSPPVSSLVALRAICSSDCGAAREQLAAAAAELQPTLVLQRKAPDPDAGRREQGVGQGGR